MNHQTNRRSWLSIVMTVLITACAFSMGVSPLQAKGGKTKVTDLSGIVPTITGIEVVNGQLVASGVATAIVKGQIVTSNFRAPLNVALAQDQTGAAAAGCPILDLSLGPINLDLLGLVVETSPICLTITAFQEGGLLGDLLCSIANGLNGNLLLSQILAGFTQDQVNDLLIGLTGLLNGALDQLLDAILTAINPGGHGSCAILHLELGPLALNLLGLEVILDNCSGGPVVVDITGETGQGNLLGNLLCELLGGGLNLRATLQGILNALTGLLTQ